MKKILFTILFVPAFLFYACNPENAKNNKKDAIPQVDDSEEVFEENTNHEYHELDYEELNKQLALKGGSMQPKDIMKMHYPMEVGEEGGEKIEVKEKELENGQYELTLTHENQLDDAVNGEKHVMVLNKKNGKWEVASLRKSWKCQEGRGKNTWGIDTCK